MKLFPGVFIQVIGNFEKFRRGQGREQRKPRGLTGDSEIFWSMRSRAENNKTKVTNGYPRPLSSRPPFQNGGIGSRPHSLSAQY